MVIGTKFNSFNMVDSLDISLESLSVLSPAPKLTAEEACRVEEGRVEAGEWCVKAKDMGFEDDTESINEADCFFENMGFEEDEVHVGALSPCFEACAQSANSAHPQPHSAPRSNDKNVVHEGPFSHYSKASAWLNSARPHQTYAERVVEEDEAYVGAFSDHSRASMKLNSVRLRSTCVRPRGHHEKENKSPCDINSGHSSVDIQRMWQHTDRGAGCAEPFASWDDTRSLPLDIAPTSPNSATSRRSRKSKKVNVSVRESLLAEAWERKRGLMLNEELANCNERAKPELLGRSSSDCGKLIIADAQNAPAPSELRKSRTRSLTDDDFEELRGCIDLGFRFDQSSVPDLCETLPALEVYCAVTQNFQESPKCMSPVIQSPARCSSPSTASSWKISSPGDDPRDVKGRLKHWAQAVACNARLCH